MIPAAYNEYRCSKCHKLFFKGVLVDSEVEVKCKKCGSLETIRGLKSADLVCLKPTCANRVVLPAEAREAA